MQFRIPAAAIVFIGSYLPLSLILLAQDFDYSALEKPLCAILSVEALKCEIPFRNPYLSVGIFLACLFCFFVTLLTLFFTPLRSQIVIQDAEHIPADLMNYVLPYIVSFMSLDYQETGKFVGFLIFLGWMFWITYKAGHIIFNPLLIAFGWRLYRIQYRFASGQDFHSGYALANVGLLPQGTYQRGIIQEISILKQGKT